MKVIHTIKFKPGSREELLPDFSPEFPYIASYVELDRYIGRQAPWHWHKEVEFFYMEQGSLEYNTPLGKTFFPSGSGGFINSNVLHMSKASNDRTPVTTLLHLFDPILISGQKGSIIDQRYVIPLITNSQIELIGLYPDNPKHRKILELLRQSFQLSEDEYAYEVHLRAILSEIWCQLLEIGNPFNSKGEYHNRISDKIKTMMIFIHENYGDKITVAEISAVAFISERECFRIFHDCLNMTPVEYIINYRIQKACHLLAETNESITDISQSCGLGSSSYFGRVFREHVGCNPMQYRKKWQNNAINRQ